MNPKRKLIIKLHDFLVKLTNQIIIIRKRKSFAIIDKFLTRIAKFKINN